MVLLGLVAATVTPVPTTPAALPATSSAAATSSDVAASGAAARGAYLALAAGCGQCHTDTKHGGRPYAGGLALKTRYGTVITPNITPDRRTGIGGWGDRDFAAAMRWGVAPGDSHYLSAFPFPFYNRLTDRDLADLKAFLDTVPAVYQPNRGGGNWRLLAAARDAIAVVATAFPGPRMPDPQRSAAWNRGAYLVATVGRCGDCHTPRNWFGAGEPDRFLAGGTTGSGDNAPDITPDPRTGIGSWSVGDIETLLKDGQKPDFDFVGGAMGEIVDNTAKLTAADRRAIAIYLRSLPPIRSGSSRPPKKSD